MATLRTRLTVTYGVTLVGGLLVFAIALYIVRVASGVDALGPTAIAQGDQVLQPLRDWALNGNPLVESQPPADSSGATVRSRLRSSASAISRSTRRRARCGAVACRSRSPPRNTRCWSTWPATPGA